MYLYEQVQSVTQLCGGINLPKYADMVTRLKKASGTRVGVYVPEKGGEPYEKLCLALEKSIGEKGHVERIDNDFLNSFEGMRKGCWTSSSYRKPERFPTVCSGTSSPIW